MGQAGTEWQPLSSPSPWGTLSRPCPSLWEGSAGLAQTGVAVAPGRCPATSPQRGTTYPCQASRPSWPAHCHCSPPRPSGAALLHQQGARIHTVGSGFRPRFSRRRGVTGDRHQSQGRSLSLAGQGQVRGQGRAGTGDRDRHRGIAQGISPPCHHTLQWAVKYLRASG